MRFKRYPAIIVSALFLAIGSIAIFNMYTNWQEDEPVVQQPLVTSLPENANNLDLQSIIHEAEKSVIQIEGQNEHQTRTGSGFLFNEKGDIITNAHVIQNMDAIYVRTADAKFYSAAVVDMSDNTDIAVIRVPQLANMDPLPLSEEIADIGDEVIALGSPHGFQNTVTLGIISGTERNFVIDGYNYSNLYQISAPITEGNSGGPLLNRETGEIIGINSVGTEDGTIGFSIPVSEVIEQVTEWSNKAVNDQLNFASIIDVINNEDTEQNLEDVIYLTEYFWDSIAIRDYVNAYSLLGSQLQQNTSYTDFRNRFISIADLGFTEVTSEEMDNNQFRTEVTITFENRQDEAEKNDEEVISEEKTFEFNFSFENDQLKIIKMEEIT